MLVQAVHRQRHRLAQAGQFVRRRALGRLQPVLQGLARHVFHDQIRHVFQIARGHKTRHMRARQGLHDLVFHFKADDVFGAVAGRHARNFHGHRKTRIAGPLGVTHAVDVGHATGMDAFLDRKTVQLGAGFQQLHRPCSSRSAK